MRPDGTGCRRQQKCCGRKGVIVQDMKSTGIVRKVDELGRIVLPIELRRTLNIGERDEMEIFVEGNTIVLRKYEPCCVFCGSQEEVVLFKDRLICRNCVAEITGQD